MSVVECVVQFCLYWKFVSKITREITCESAPMKGCLCSVNEDTYNLKSQK